MRQPEWRRCLCRERRHLDEGEHEHQVEEHLERRGPMGWPGGHLGGRARKMCLIVAILFARHPTDPDSTLFRQSPLATTDDFGAARGYPLVGDGRVDLYAGFCARRVPRGVCAGGGHPSRPAVAGRLQRPTRRHRAGSPQASAPGRHLAVTALAWPCSGWGLPSHPGHPGCWWALTPPFHPYRPRCGSAVCFLWHCPAGRPGLPLTTTLPCGVRTFLGGGPKPADATARSTRPSRPHPNDERLPVFRPAWARSRSSGRSGESCREATTSLVGLWISPTPRCCSPPVSPLARSTRWPVAVR